MNMPKVGSEHTDIVWSRVDAVVQLILGNDRYMQSKRNSELRNLVKEQFGIKDRQAQKYILEAKKEIRKLGNDQKKQAFIKAIRDREFLFSKAKTSQIYYDKDGKPVTTGDYKLALEIIKDRDKLFGLYVEEVNVNQNINAKLDLSGLTNEELKALANIQR